MREISIDHHSLHIHTRARSFYQLVHQDPDLTTITFALLYNHYDYFRPHVILWVVFMVIYTILLALIPATWISYIWDQIIDPQFDLEHIEQPDNKLIKFFYKVGNSIWNPFLTTIFCSRLVEISIQV